MTSTATMASFNGSDSSAIAAYASRASIASSGPARASVIHSSSSGGAGAVRRRAAAFSLPRPRVAEHSQQVRQVVVALHEARAAQHAFVRLLHEILGILARAAHRVRRAQQARPMASQPRGLERLLCDGRFDALSHDRRS